MATAPDIEIEKGVPLPRTRKRAIYPWNKLEVGDSFFVPEPSKFFGGQVSNAGRLYGRKFVRRAVEGGVRVWRTA